LHGIKANNNTRKWDMLTDKMTQGINEILRDASSFIMTFINRKEDGTWDIKITHKNDSACISQKFIEFNIAKSTGNI